jgi:signal transduction histidine kinase
VIEHVAQLAMKGTKIGFEVETEEKKTLIEMDPEVLKQILLNLFLNAVQAMEQVERPLLKVRLRRIKSKKAFNLGSLPLLKVWEGWRHEKTSSSTDYLEIEVKDNGPGIDLETQRRLFVPFFTTKSKGTGLGLAICRRLMESVGGTINVRSKEGFGTTFVLHLPMDRQLIGDRFEKNPIKEETA